MTTFYEASLRKHFATIGQSRNPAGTPWLRITLRTDLAEGADWLRVGIRLDHRIEVVDGLLHLVLERGRTFEVRPQGGRRLVVNVAPVMVYMPMDWLPELPVAMHWAEPVTFEVRPDSLTLCLPQWAQPPAPAIQIQDPAPVSVAPARPPKPTRPPYQGICDRVPDPAATLRRAARLLPPFPREF